MFDVTGTVTAANSLLGSLELCWCLGYSKARYNSLKLTVLPDTGAAAIQGSAALTCKGSALQEDTMYDISKYVSNTSIGVCKSVCLIRVQAGVLSDGQNV